MQWLLKILDPVLALPGWIAVYALLLTLLVFLSPSWLPEPNEEFLLDRVFFTYVEEVSDAEVTREVSERITLPHDRRKNENWNEAGWYEIYANFTAPVDQTLSLYITHVQQRANLWIDDVPFGSNIPEYVVSGQIWSKPVLRKLPHAALTEGSHKISIYLESEPPRNGLLGRVYLGPEKDLRSYWEWRYHYRFTLVAIITFGMLSLSMLMGVLWLLRKKDTMYAWFTICTLFWSMHNIPHIIDIPRNMSPALWDALYFILLGWTVVSLIVFNHRYTNTRYPRREKFLFIFALAGALPFFFLSHEGIHEYASLFWDLSLLPIGAYTIYYLAQAHQRNPVIEIKLLFMAGLIIITFGLQDYLVLAGILDRTRGLLIQFSGLPAMLVLIWFLFSRFIKVLNESESLNLELEKRVKAKEKELQENFERLKLMENEQLLSDERSRIMQDVHDGVGGQLVAMLAELETGKVSQEDVRDALSQSLTDLRLVIDSLDVASEDLPTLLGMLRTRLQPRLDGHEMKLHWGVVPLPRLADFGPEKALQLMRILQEIFVNILKHSKAKNIYLDTAVMQSENNLEQIEIIVRDDGRWQEAADKTGRGLINMQRRANSIGVKLQIAGETSGTTVKIILGSGRTVPASQAS